MKGIYYVNYLWVAEIRFATEILAIARIVYDLLVNGSRLESETRRSCEGF